MKHDIKGLAADLKLDERLLRFLTHDAEIEAYDDDTLLDVINRATPELLDEIQAYEDLRTADRNLQKGDQLFNIIEQEMEEKRDQIAKLHGLEEDMIDEFPGLEKGLNAMATKEEELLTEKELTNFREAAQQFKEFVNGMESVRKKRISHDRFAEAHGVDPNFVARTEQKIKDILNL